MAEFWKAVALALITAVLALTVGKKDISLVLSLGACCLVGAIAAAYLKPVLGLLEELGALGEVSGETLEILTKAVGIALVSEMAGLICADAGNGSLGKLLQMLGSAAILCLSLPLFRGLLALIREILGEL